MILKGAQRGGSADLAVHLMKDENDHVLIHELRGFVAEDLRGALHEAYAVSKGTRCKQFLFAVSLNPPPDYTVATPIFEKAIKDIEERLGLTDQPRAIVFHEKEGRRHAHCVWSRIDTKTMTAINLPHFKRKLQDVSRELFVENDWRMPLGLIDKTLKNPLNFSREEWQQALRTKQDPGLLKSLFQQAWAASDNRKAFANALEERGFWLCRGDRRGFVAIDMKGEVYAIAKWTGQRTRAVREKLGNENDLDGIERTQARIASRMTPKLKTLLKDADLSFQKQMAKLAFRKSQIVQHQREERKALKAHQKARWARETRTRAARLSRGFKGIWDRLTGKYAKIRDENDAHAYDCFIRDRSQRDRLTEEHLNERRLFQKYVALIRAQHHEQQAGLRCELARQLNLAETPQPKRDFDNVITQKPKRKRGRRKQI